MPLADAVTIVETTSTNSKTSDLLVLSHRFEVRASRISSVGFFRNRVQFHTVCAQTYFASTACYGSKSKVGVI